MIKKMPIVELPIESLVPAEWNYKQEGDPEQIEKLKSSVEFDSSMGVPAVREIEVDGQKKFEVIDGNHRLTVARQLDMKTLTCENFGAISDAKAVTVAMRRNHKWFDDDLLKLGKLMSDIVIPEISIESLDQFMPNSHLEMEALANIGKGSWEHIDHTKPSGGGGGASSENSEGFETLSLSLPASVMALWSQWKARMISEHGEEINDIQVFEYAIAEALNTQGKEPNDAPTIG